MLIILLMLIIINYTDDDSGDHSILIPDVEHIAMNKTD